MVKIKEHLPELINGSIDIESWLGYLKRNYGYTDLRRLHKALNILESLTYYRRSYENYPRSPAELSYLNIGINLVNILASLNLDINSLIAGAFYFPIRDNVLALNDMVDHFNESIAKLIVNVHGMAAISECYNPNNKINIDSYKQQSIKIRKMLISIIDDPRVALIKLAERCCVMRELKYYPTNIREKIATEVFEIYAPLAHRLNIGCIKWELEDLSFRYINPDEYKKIAQLLDGKRLVREQYVKNVTTKLKEKLANNSIKAEVTGRVKHIYSIWRKMQKKNTSFENLYDIRAARITANSIQDCYAALSIVHTLWRNIPGEFDDYIASPKENGYRSLHTAIFGPDSKTVEIQIRTQEMHDEAELGICSHWKYKEVDQDTTDNIAESKIAWLQKVMKWNEEIRILDNNNDKKHPVDTERVYVFSKNADVIDLPRGATPVDFAYKIHSDLGNRCCGAKVFKQIVPLNYTLKTGDKIEILTSLKSTPSRDWLNQKQGYITTKTAKYNVVTWFNRQDKIKNISLGKTIIEKELKKNVYQNISITYLTKKLGFDNTNRLYLAVGTGKIKSNYLLQVLTKIIGGHPIVEQYNNKPTNSKIKQIYDSNIHISGMKNILTKIANCCKPIPGDTIKGYITKNNGITIHKNNCSIIYYLQKNKSSRIIVASWINGNLQFYPADIIIESVDRPKLLHDITQVFVNNKANVIRLNYKNNSYYKSHIKLKVTIEIPSYTVLNKVLTQIKKIPNITSAQRIQI